MDYLDNSYFDENRIVPKSDVYEDLFRSVIMIFKTLRKKGGYMYSSTSLEEHIKTNFDSSGNLLKRAIEIICECYDDRVFNLVVEFEFNKALVYSSCITEQELFELTLTKELVRYIRLNDANSIYSLLTCVCTGQVIQKLVPTIDWAD